MNDLNETPDTKGKSTKKILAAGIAAAIAVILAVVFVMLQKGGKDLTATTIRILCYVGDVTLSSGDQELTLREDMQLHNGNRVSTAKNGSVDLALDDSKTVGLDVESSAAFHQEGKALSVHLESGSLIFYTTEKLADNESMDVETQTMMVGLRGTSGQTLYNPENGVSRAVATSGTLYVEAVNPNTGGRASAEVPAGSVVQTYFYNYEEGDASISLSVRRAKPEDISPFLMQKIMENPAVRDEVASQNNWSMQQMQSVAESAQVVNAAVPGSESFSDNSSAFRESSLTQTLITSYDSIAEAENSTDPVAQEAAREQRERQDNNPDGADAQEPAAAEEAEVADAQPADGDTQNNNQTNADVTAGNGSQNAGANAAAAPADDAVPAPADAAAPTAQPQVTGSSSDTIISVNSSGSSSSSSGSSGSSGSGAAPAVASIAVEQPANGTIQVDKTTASAGETVTITMTASAGYKPLSVTVSPDGAVGDAVPVSGMGGTYTFTMPSYNVKVTGTVAKAYEIQVDCQGGGTVAASPSPAAAGETVSLTVTPESGKRLAYLKVLKASSMEDAILAVEYNTSTGKYDDLNNSGSAMDLSALKFTMPEDNVKIIADFVESSEAEKYTITEISESGTSSGSSTGGNVKVNPPSPVAAGTQVSITVTPDSGSMLGTLTVRKDGAASEEIILQIVYDSEDNVYKQDGKTIQLNAEALTFTMPESDVMVSATFIEARYTVTLGNGCEDAELWIGNISGESQSEGQKIEAGKTPVTSGTKVNVFWRDDQTDYNIEIINRDTMDSTNIQAERQTGGLYNFIMPDCSVIVRLKN